MQVEDGLLGVCIRGSMHVPPNWIQVPGLMANWIDGFRTRSAEEHPIRYAARAHIDLAGIHPFTDGNGRVCTMVVNLLLMGDGHPPALHTNTACICRPSRLPRSKVGSIDSCGSPRTRRDS